MPPYSNRVSGHWNLGTRSSRVAGMRYFLDTEYDGFGGPLISLALVPEDGGEELYLVLDQDATDPWVERNVIPFLDHVLVEYVSQLPDSMKLSGWTTKRILR